MSSAATAPQFLLSLPPAMSRDFARLENRPAPQWLAVCDPADSKLGAGGGGYRLIFAKDETAAQNLRRDFTQNPPNPTARFVDFSISREGLAITRS